MPAAHVDLDRGQDEPRHFQRRIALLAHRDELGLGNALMEMTIGGALCEHRCFPNVVIAVGGLVVVAERAEERRVGKEWVRTFRSRWSPQAKKKKNKKKNKR